MKSSHAARGVVAMSCSAVLFAIMAAVIRSAPGIDTYRMSFFRFAVGLAVLGSLAMAGKIELRGRKPGLLLLRGILGAIAVLLFYLSIVWLGMAKGAVLHHTYPLFAALFGAWFLRERVGPVRWALIFAACIGIWLVTADAGTFTSISLYDALALLGAAVAGSAVVVVRKLRVDHSPFTIYLAQCGIGFWVMLLPASLQPADLGFSGGLILLTIGLTATAGQLTMTYAYRHLTVVGGRLLSMITPVLSAVIGVLLFHESIGLRGGIGILLVLTCCMALCVFSPRPITIPDGDYPGGGI